MLGLLLFEPPRQRSATDVARDVVRPAAAWALFYLKIDLFRRRNGDPAGRPGRLPTCARRWRGWSAVFAGAAALIILPFNRPYLADLIAAAQRRHRARRRGLLLQRLRRERRRICRLVRRGRDCLVAVATRAGAAAARRRRHFPAGDGGHDPVAKFAGARHSSGRRHRVPVPRPLATPAGAGGRSALAVLAFPLASIVTSATSIASYHARLSQGYMRIVETTNLSGPRRADGAGRPARRYRGGPRRGAPASAASRPSGRATSSRRTSMSRP